MKHLPWVLTSLTLILVAVSFVHVRPVLAEWTMNVKVSGSGANCELVFTEDDFNGQSVLYGSLGEEGYKDFIAGLLKSYLGWTVFKPSMKVNIDHSVEVMKVNLNLQDVVEIKGHRQTINLKPLKDDGWSWRREGNLFIFESSTFPREVGFTGPFKILVNAPPDALDLRFNEETYEISYLTPVPFPLASILIGLLVGLTTIAMLRKRIVRQRGKYFEPSSISGVS